MTCHYCQTNFTGGEDKKSIKETGACCECYDRLLEDREG
jgi:hypothetical protein